MAINDPYRTLGAASQPSSRVASFLPHEIEMEIGNAHSMEEFFVTAAQTRTDDGGARPDRPNLRGRHRAGIPRSQIAKDIASSGI